MASTLARSDTIPVPCCVFANIEVVAHANSGPAHADSVVLAFSCCPRLKAEMKMLWTGIRDESPACQAG